MQLHDARCSKIEPCASNTCQTWTIDFEELLLHGFDLHLQLLQHECCLGTLGVPARVRCFEAVEFDYITRSHRNSRVALGRQRGTRNPTLPKEHAHAIDPTLRNRLSKQTKRAKRGNRVKQNCNIVCDAVTTLAIYTAHKHLLYK